MTNSDQIPANAASADRDAVIWRPLWILCSYRVAVAGLLLLGFLTSRVGTVLLDTPNPDLFLFTALLYLAFGAGALALSITHHRGYETQVFTQISVDVLAIATLIHAAGGVDAGLGVLMVVAVAGGSLLVGVRLGTFFAALATLAMFFEHTLTHLGGGANDNSGFTRVAFLGIATFATALTGSLLARRAQENRALAERRGIDVANLEALNAHIVQRLDTGVVALDPAGGVRLTNSTAREMLGQRRGLKSPVLTDVAPILAGRFERWRESWDADESPIATADGATEYVPRFQPLGPGGQNGTLIFLENVTQMRAQVQQAKLASLGRLTASIAHEVRNPLAAMLQAAQLLGEAEYLKRGDLRLVEIIGKQGRRMNKTIDNVLQLSRRAPPSRERLDLSDWLPQIAAEWREQQGPDLAGIDLRVEADTVFAEFDPGHLQQIIENLLRNAAEHAGHDGHPPRVVLRGSVIDEGVGVIEIEDNGPGVVESIRSHLFEPFATASKSGTGLGLYLARELCEANQARITLRDATPHGACFRILFTRAMAGTERQRGVTRTLEKREASS